MNKIILIMLFLTSAIGFTQEMNRYCASPPFVGGKTAVVKPNILICQDMTGSMLNLTGQGSYGYANPNYRYKLFEVNPHRAYLIKDEGGSYSGDSINLNFMTRIDVARKVLTGGKGPNVDNKDTLFFAQPGWVGGKLVYGIITTDSTERSKGVIREIADKDNNFMWDADAPNFALQQFSTNGAFGRKILCPFGDSLKRFLRQIETPTPTGNTWVGDAVFEAIHYIRYCEPHWTAVDYTWSEDDVGTPVDSWYEVVAEDTVSVSCRPTFVIVISDGESNSDNPVADSPDLPHPDSPYGSSYWAFNLYNGPDSSDGDNGCADDYAYYGHIVDLRPDNDPDSIYIIPDKQTITFYSIFLFANQSGARLSKNIAKYGGFNDLNANLKPDLQAEWDADGDNEPDNYFYADEGNALEDAFREIFINIQVLARITSASAAAITSSGIQGGGIAYQAQFYPKLELASDTLDWVGSIQALWLDPYGYLREDTDQNDKLHLKDDYVIDMYYSVGNQKIMAKLFEDTSGLGIQDQFVYRNEVPVENLRSIWNAAGELLGRGYSSRLVYAGTKTGITGFQAGNTTFRSDLLFGGAAQSDSLVNYILGLDYPDNPNYRSRTFGSDVWKLGDIIHSSPLVVEAPMENYHQIYGDATYYSFWDKYRNRTCVVYAGANDGMIHAFSGGTYQTLNDPFEIAELTQYGNHPLGSELWAYIPRNLLPHLKWLKDTTYCHVYYNDLKLYATDAKIFSPGEVHPEGWGTMLICGQRFGGTEIAPLIGVAIYRSAYTAFDITANPGGLSFMWKFDHAELGYTMCVPTVIKIRDAWFLILGSGPQTLYGESKQQAKIFVLNLSTGQMLRSIGIPDVNSVITNVFGVDCDLNYSVDLIYFGTYDNMGGGKIYRIMTHEDSDPNGWTLHPLIDLEKPVTAEGSVATDDRGKLWVYFGTGKYYSNVDIANVDTMLFIGVIDDTTRQPRPGECPAFNLADLLDVTNIEVFADSVTGYENLGFDGLVADAAQKGGWYRRLDSIPGERVVTTPTVLGGAVVFSSFIPTDTMGNAMAVADLCLGGSGTQSGNLWALYYLTGTAYRAPILGEDANGAFLTHISVAGDMPSEPVMHIGSKQEKVFIQTAGGLIDFTAIFPYDPRGGVMLWRGR